MDVGMKKLIYLRLKFNPLVDHLGLEGFFGVQITELGIENFLQVHDEWISTWSIIK